MSQIRLTPDQLREKGSQYREQSGIIEETIATLDRLLNELEEQFEGAASQRFAAQFGEIRPHFVDAQEMTATLSQQMNQMAENFEQLDNDMASQLGGM